MTAPARRREQDAMFAFYVSLLYVLWDRAGKDFVCCVALEHICYCNTLFVRYRDRACEMQKRVQEEYLIMVLGVHAQAL